MNKPGIYWIVWVVIFKHIVDNKIDTMPKICYNLIIKL